MNEPPNMLSTVTPWDMVAEGYAETTMTFFRSYTEKALELARLSKDCKILDVACGPGTLPLLVAAKVNSVHAIDFSESMISLFRNAISEQGIKNIEVHCGDGQALPYTDGLFDTAFSMFGLMFFPDREKGYKEIFRTLRPGGKVVISSWAPVCDSTLMQTLFGAIKAMKPEIPEPQTDIESLENPEFFRNELTAAGFADVDIIGFSGEFPVNNVKEFWTDMVKGSAPIVMMKNDMSNDQWNELETVALGYLSKQLPNMPTTLSSKAWFGVGVKP
ncbi:MAG: class I SAM-dependent methyltransferase [Gammaproteobacteria bacterium]|nr:class I SAM-dependent methyltransferase [Gammaproteobacteria bacterium]MDH5803435.1 class I SAM-dependent methyltransferase [Gammaproteobacteria bacterium]